MNEEKSTGMPPPVSKHGNTVGESRVRVNFNVAASDEVGVMKRETALLIDALEAQKAHATPEKLRLIALAQTAFEEAAMWGVKAITY